MNCGSRHFLVLLARLRNVYFHVALLAVLLTLLIVDGKSTKGEYPYSAGKCISEQRGGVASRGIIISPNYPLPYPLGMCYIWHITAQTPGEIITISFSDLDLHSGPDGECSLDFIEIGPSPQQYIQCGSLPDTYPPPFISVKSNTWVRFVTAPQTEVRGSRRGFSLTYIIGDVPAQRCEDDEFRCNNSKCILDNWRCNGGDECGDGSDESGCHVIVKPTQPPDNACGVDKFACVSAATRQLTCFMNIQRCNGKVDCLSEEDEQHCENQKPCGAMLSSKDSGYFTSPNFPLNYPTAIECEWVILVPETDVIQLRFDVFNLESGFGTDYVVIYDGQDQNSDEIGKYYGKHVPPAVVQSSSYKMFVKFHSDASIPQQGFNVTYQVKGVCLKNQLACGFKERECYEVSQGCDGHWDCPIHGGDERGCGSCKPDEFSCEKESQCYAEKERCDGKGKCRNYSDEKHCSPDLCGPLNGTFLCKNGRCIQETWQCDNQPDCTDGSDEINCPVTTRVVTAAVIGSLICGLLLVIALGCTCKLYALRMQDQYGGRYETPLTRIQNQIGRRRAPPPYNEAMVTSRPYDEVQRERREQLLSQQESGRQSNNGRRNSLSNNSPESVGGTPTTASGVQRNTSDSSLLSQNVDIVAAGCVAQWRRTRPNKHTRQDINTAQNAPNSSGTTSREGDEDSACASVDSFTVSVDGDSSKPETSPAVFENSNLAVITGRQSEIESISSEDSDLLDANHVQIVQKASGMQLPATSGGRSAQIGSVSSADSVLIDDANQEPSVDFVATANIRRGSISSVESTTSDTRLLLS